MMEASVIPAAAPARLLLIEGESQLAPARAAPLAAEFAAAPIVVELRGGRQALELLRASPYDVVAADLDALADLADRIEDRISRLARAAAGALILVLSDDASISVALSAMRAGAHDCVGKSCDASALVQRIGDLAPPPRQGPAAGAERGERDSLGEPGSLDPGDARSGAADVAAGAADHRDRHPELCRKHRAGGGCAGTQPVDDLPQTAGLGRTRPSAL